MTEDPEAPEPAAGGFPLEEPYFAEEPGSPLPEPGVPAPRSFWSPLRDTRVWGLLVLRGYLALVFFQAALGHLQEAPAVLAAQWSPHGPFQSLGAQVSRNPAFFVDLVIGIEIGLALSVTVGFLTRWAGLGGLLLNSFFFAAFEWTDANQLYLSWDASLAALWLIVLLTAPGQYLGLGQLLGRKFPRLKPWLS
jgi:uncharacterized membrane protein YphA (DoxX/SURF4 family)